MPSLNMIQTILAILVSLAVLGWYGLQFYKEFTKKENK